MQSLALEVAIGLALVFLIASLLASAVNEIASRSLNIRSKALWTRLDELMNKDSKQKSLGYPFIVKGIVSWVRPRHNETPEATGKKQDPLTVFANTASIHALDYVSAGKKTKVWKISGDVFASAVLELAETKGADGSLQERIKALSEEDAYKSTPLGEVPQVDGHGIGHKGRHLPQGDRTLVRRPDGGAQQHLPT